ncbi:MAG TPA: hypothetical protein V6D18_08110 [Thermosynechococcaceae cyanobacterium]
MQLTDRPIPLANSTLNTLIQELGVECSYVLSLISQLQLPTLQPDQKADILAELLAATIHLNSHCDEEFQGAIADELEALPDAGNDLS